MCPSQISVVARVKLVASLPAFPSFAVCLSPRPAVLISADSTEQAWPWLRARQLDARQIGLHRIGHVDAARCELLSSSSLRSVSICHRSTGQKCTMHEDCRELGSEVKKEHTSPWILWKQRNDCVFDGSPPNLKW
ncbi:hypothetical protein PAHAL_1G201400 [Panicum hallii]|uniref:Uncharacterized protein n=1 Tax=Panicum hallii TaxID=206008 RepID=A0A2T8KVU9_9POAL|nr:hypothetical protein PAHAL_1G201400 [Panicum hallii]